MKRIQLTIDHQKRIEAANFVSRQPPYQWADDARFSCPHHFLYFHLDGFRKVGIDGDCYTVGPGDMVFYFGKRDFYSPMPDTSYKAMNVTFLIEPDDQLLSENRLRDRRSDCVYLPLVFPARLNSSTHFLFEEIVYSFISASRFKNRKAPFLLSQLLLEVAEIHAQRSGATSTSVDTVVGLLERNPGTNWSIDELASKANMSRATLTRHFRRSTGKSILQFQLDIKLKHALSIFRNNPEIKVKEVAEMLGFYDEYHFSKAFKRKFNLPPSQYRRNGGNG